MQHSILVLDDDIYVRESLLISLEDEGFEVFGAESSEHALIFLEDNQIDMVIVDLRLPGMNGTEFINSASVKWPNIKFIIYTGSPEFCIPANLALKPNVSNSVFLKPLPSFDVIIAEIRQMLG